MSLRIALFCNGSVGDAICRRLVAEGHTLVALSGRRRPAFAELRYRLGRHLVAMGLAADDFHGGRALPSGAGVFEFARAHGIPFLDPDRIRQPDFRQAIESAAPDLLLTAGYHRKIPAAVAALARKAAINIHPAPLPRYRGPTPNHWLVHEGAAATALTAHRLDQEIDTGPIALERVIPLDPQASWGSAQQAIVAAMPDFVASVVKAVEAGSVAWRDQESADARYQPNFKTRMLKIDWSQPAASIARLCLAFGPVTGPRCFWEQRQLCVWRARPSMERRADARSLPGTILAVEPDVVRVGTGEGDLEILQFLKRGKPVSAGAHARKIGLTPGARFAASGHASERGRDS